MFFSGNRLRYYITYILILITAFVLLGSLGWGGYPARAQVNLLNDRAADMVGATPLAARDLVLPAGLTGRGQIVGLADSGLDKGSLVDMHPDLQSVPGQIPKVILLRSWAGRSVPDDPVGHGTHMAASIAGTGKASGGKYRGIAPGASLYVQGLLDDNGKLTVPADITELFWPAYSAGVRIHVNGWGGGGNVYGSAAGQVDGFVREHPDFLPIFGAGNSGPARASLTSEANSKNALVVGASQVPRPALGPDARDSGQAASFSSRGPAGDGRIKPDLVVPSSAVISACSRLTKSNFAPNPAYTCMGGTSMAAAIAGGAGALLSEYLEAQREKPSAALLKALFINCARPPAAENAFSQGFGVLDAAGTILGLKEKTFHYVDSRSGLQEGQTAEYRFRVTQPGLPVRVTLAWTDPPAGGGSYGRTLVNNLDLVVEGPKGSRYLGNHFTGLTGPDTLNNVEQVRIPAPVPGEYIVKVKATRIEQTVRPGTSQPVQDFALVYGQTLRTGTVYSAEGETMTLADGEELDIAGKRVRLVINGTARPFTPGAILPGSDIYAGDNCLYIFSRTWEGEGVQVVRTPQGLEVMEINREVRSGGFFLHPAVEEDISRFIFLNGRPVQNTADIPPGVALEASVSPSTQTLWQLKAGYIKKAGIIGRVDANKGEVQLLEDGSTYRLAPGAALSFSDQVVDSGTADAPYGTAEAADLKQIMPGMPVDLLLVPETGEVQYISVTRQVAQGQPRKVEPEAARVILETGSAYQVFPGAAILRDEVDASLAQIQPGDYLKLLLLPTSKRVIQVQSYSRAVYGRVIYASEKDGKMYINDCNNRICTLDLTGQTQVFRWNLPVGAGAIPSGSWVRVILAADGKTALRVDIAEVAREAIKIFSGYDAGEGTITTADRERFSVGRTTLVTRNGYAIGVQDLIPGEKVRLAVLSVPPPGPGYCALIEAEEDRAAGAPAITAAAQELNGALIIQGRTSGNRVYLYRQDGSRETLAVDAAGSFSRVTRLLPGETSVQMAALDTRTGGITGVTVQISHYPAAAEPSPYTFSDTGGYKYKEAIQQLCSRGILGGYPDGSFRPYQPVTRLELVLMLVRARGLEPQENPGNVFRDFARIPVWARAMVASAKASGLVVGYPDRTFRPGQPATRSEVAVFVNRAFGNNTEQSLIPPYQDFADIPRWARTAVAQGYRAGFLNMLSDLLPVRFLPSRPVTRGEAAAMIQRAME